MKASRLKARFLHIFQSPSLGLSRDGGGKINPALIGVSLMAISLSSIRTPTSAFSDLQRSLVDTD